MRQLEIINLRSSTCCIQSVVNEELKSYLNEVTQNSNTKIHLLIRDAVNTDLGVHIYKKVLKSGKSEEGIFIENILKELGMINYGIWKYNLDENGGIYAK